jgi:hypothetical protein
MFRFNHHHPGAYYLCFAATPPKQPQRCLLTDYFNNCNFSKGQIISSLMMMMIKPKHVGAVLM